MTNRDKILEQFQIKVLDIDNSPEHFHNETELLYVLEGTLTLIVGEQQFQMKKEDVVVVNENKRHSYTTTEGTLFCEIAIPYEIMNGTIEESKVFFWCNSTIEQNEAYDELRIILRKMLNLYVRGDWAAHSFSQLGLFFNMLEVLNFHFRVSEKNKLSVKDRYDDRIATINNYIRNRYNEPISLNELSKMLYLSNAYLSRFFKKNYGMNFVTYLTNVRLFHAVDDLIYTDKPITRIALDNGFASVTLFNKMFRDVHGETPTMFRNKSRKEKQENDNEVSPIIQEKVLNFLMAQKNETNMYNAGKNMVIHGDAANAQFYDKNWNQVINMGVARGFLDAGVQEHALLMKKKFGFSCMRIWNLFSEEMFVPTDFSLGIENFRHFDIVLDFFVENDIIPFLELNMNARYAINDFNREVLQKVKHDENPQLVLWGKVLEDFFRHIIHRYGRTTVETWKFDIWDGWQGEDYTDKQIIYYLEGFKKAYSHIKSLLPKSQVGGCGSSGLFDAKRFVHVLQMWQTYAPLPDFFSAKIYGYIKGEEDNDVFAKRSTDPDFISHELERMQGYFETYNFPVERLYISEWGHSLSNRNIINDSCFRAAFNMKKLIQCIGKADLMVYNGGSDRVSEYYDTKELLFGGSGVVTKDSIIKPSGYVCLFMNQLYDKFLQKGENYLVTTDEYENYRIVCHNCKKLNYYYYVTDENELQKDKIWQCYEDTDEMVLEFLIHNVESGEYQIQIQQINENKGSVLDLWKEMNYYDNLPREVIQYLQQMSQPQISLRRVNVTDGELHMNLKLMANEIAYIKVEKLL